MNSIVVHYKELALKGRNRPWFVQILDAQPAHARSPASTSRAPRRSWAASRSTSGDPDVVAEVRERMRRVFGIANFSHAGRASARFRCAGRAPFSQDLGDRHADSFRVSARRCRQAVSVHVAADRARGRRAASRKRRGWHVDLERPGAHDSPRDAARRGVLLLRQGAGRRRTADRHRRTRRLPALGRHRFAGRGVPDDAARLLGAARSTSTAIRSCRARRRRRCARSRRC